MTATDPKNGSNADATPTEVVRPFVDPMEEWRSMAKIGPRDAVLWAIFLNRHARRARRNKHRLMIARDLALFTRSQDAFGSQQAAEVAKKSNAATGNLLDKLVGQARREDDPDGDDE